MIQLKKSNTTNTFAFYPDVEVTSSISALEIEYVQDLGKASGSFEANVSSQKNWIVGTVAGSSIPTPSGQYTLTIKRATLLPGLVWGTTNTQWALTDVAWADTTPTVAAETLATERAYIEGGNEVTYTTYNSPNETGTYTTYNS